MYIFFPNQKPKKQHKITTYHGSNSAWRYRIILRSDKMHDGEIIIFLLIVNHYITKNTRITEMHLKCAQNKNITQLLLLCVKVFISKLSNDFKENIRF